MGMGKLCPRKGIAFAQPVGNYARSQQILHCGGPDYIVAALPRRAPRFASKASGLFAQGSLTFRRRQSTGVARKARPGAETLRPNHAVCGVYLPLLLVV